MATQYYLMGTGPTTNLARKNGQEYAYLRHETGEWIPHARVADRVTGHRGDSGIREITLAQARKWVKQAVPTIEPIWVDGMDT